MHFCSAFGFFFGEVVFLAHVAIVKEVDFVVASGLGNNAVVVEAECGVARVSA